MTAMIAVIAVFVSACGGSSGGGAAAGTSKLSDADAQSRLEKMVLQPADVGPGYTRDAADFQTDDQLARARPDTDQARTQYAEWGQLLQLNVQIAAPSGADLVYTAKIARVVNTAAIFQTPEGADGALSFTRDLPASVVANFLLMDSGESSLTDTQVLKDIDFPAKGDASFAWRVTGKATLADGFTVTLIADTVFVRAGRVTGNITVVGLGEAPARDQVTALVDAFVSKAEAVGP
jgi:hypothetical protein